MFKSIRSLIKQSESRALDNAQINVSSLTATVDSNNSFSRGSIKIFDRIFLRFHLQKVVYSVIESG